MLEIGYRLSLGLRQVDTEIGRENGGSWWRLC